MRKYKIGITFNLESKTTDIWSNGANQNIIHLYHLFKHSALVEKVVLVSWGEKKRTVPPAGFMLSDEIEFAYIDDVIDELDVLIEGVLIIEPDKAAKIHKRGGKVVSYKIGNDYVMDIEYTIFEKPAGRVLNGTEFDAIWTLPHHKNTCYSYFSIMHRCPVYVVPNIWSPLFCDKIIAALKPKGVTFGYQSKSGAKRLACFEPNINVVKSSFTPILIGEQAYRTAPEKIAHFYACNTFGKKDVPTFFNFIGRTNLVRDGVLSVEGRYQMPDFLGRYVDIVLSHQWENGFNYAYADALYGGYPLIHNSTLLPAGVGYYYEGFDAFAGAEMLLSVIDKHDNEHEAYKMRANAYLDSLSPMAAENIQAYESALLALFT